MCEASVLTGVSVCVSGRLLLAARCSRRREMELVSEGGYRGAVVIVCRQVGGPVQTPIMAFAEEEISLEPM